LPADDKASARLIVSQIVIGAFDELKMSYPETGEARRNELSMIHEALEKQIARVPSRPSIRVASRR
jgi:hypothetical protein